MKKLLQLFLVEQKDSEYIQFFYQEKFMRKECQSRSQFREIGGQNFNPKKQTFYKHYLRELQSTVYSQVHMHDKSNLSHAHNDLNPSLSISECL